MQILLSIFAISLSAVSVLIAWTNYRKNYERQKRQATVEYYKKMRIDMSDAQHRIEIALQKHEKSIIRVLENDDALRSPVRDTIGALQQFCASITLRIFDFDTFFWLSGSWLLRQYRIFAPYIEFQREDREYDRYAEEFERIALKIEYEIAKRKQLQEKKRQDGGKEICRRKQFLR